MDSTPDMTQTDTEAYLPGGGNQYCAPVAVSNSFMWLADRGFDNLVKNLTARKEAQAEVARILGTWRYMGTSLENGTGTTKLTNGVSRYIEHRGYQYRRLEYQGWRKHPGRFRTGVAVPELGWIKNGLIGNSAVWLNIGWYEYNPSTDKYRRIGGHWVTLVGFGVGQNGKEDPNILIVHDPAPRAGQKPSHEFVRVERISSGELTGKNSGLPRSAVGYYKLTDGMHMRKNADFAILDGVVVLQMQELAE